MLYSERVSLQVDTTFLVRVFNPSSHLNPRVGVWTDDFHNRLSVLKWR